MSGAVRIRRRRWTAAEDKALRLHYEAMPAAELAALIDRTEDAVWIRARHAGLGKRQEEARPWTDHELEELFRCYDTDRPRDIAARLGRTTSAVSQQAACLGLVSRKTLISRSAVHDYFSAVSRPEQAYILGLLAADGCVGSRHPRVHLGLQAKDAHLVEFVRDRLCPEAALFRTENGFTTLQVTSRQMVSDLAAFGVVPRKSRILQWPGCLGDMLRPYLLGYFDGDGTAYAIRGKYPGWSVCSGSEAFLVSLKEFVREGTGVVMEKIHHRPGSDLYQVATTGRGAYVVNEWLHQEGLGLARKRFAEHLTARYRPMAA